jgi:AcrR family transcriptional regulator/transcriptional regulator with XRE-family HTH domain
MGLGEADVGLEIRAARVARGTTLRGLARAIGVSPATLSAIENGNTAVSVSRLRVIASELGMAASELLPLSALRLEPRVVRTTTAVPVTPQVVGWRHFQPLDVDPVLRAAITAFGETGYHGTSMRSIAARASMSVPGVYHHYLNKQELLVRILDLATSELLWRVAEARAEGATCAERLRFIVECLALFHTHRRDLAFIGTSEMRSLEPVNRRRVAALSNDIQRIMDAEIDGCLDECPSNTLDRRVAGRAISTMCTSLPQWFRATGPSTPEQIATEYADFALALIGYPVTSPPR